MPRDYLLRGTAVSHEIRLDELDSLPARGVEARADIVRDTLALKLARHLIDTGMLHVRVEENPISRALVTTMTAVVAVPDSSARQLNDRLYRAVPDDEAPRIATPAMSAGESEIARLLRNEIRRRANGDVHVDIEP